VVAFEIEKSAQRGVCLRKRGGAEDKVGITVDGAFKGRGLYHVHSCVAICRYLLGEVTEVRMCA
jgi:hypothetical protein